MSMTAVQNPAEVTAAAYRLTTDGAITHPAPWQVDLYTGLSQPDHEAAQLLLTPAGAGKTEAVIIASLGLRRGGAPRRLFLIRPDGATLDDPLYRVVPYLRAWVAADETPRTLCVDITDEEGNGNQCRRFFPDGSEDPHVITNPLEADVDLILTTLSRFRALFFGSGGIHALTSALPIAESDHAVRRDLFFFDEAHSYQSDAFAMFHRLVEFLYAEDSDIIVASSTMPVAYQEELSFLDTHEVGDGSAWQTGTSNGGCILTYSPGADPQAEIEAALRETPRDIAQTIVVLESSAAAETLYSRLSGDLGAATFLYHAEQPPDVRLATYAGVRRREQEQLGYVLVTTGDALEPSDLNASRLLTTVCTPESLIRRAGRCNRRHCAEPGHVRVFGSQLAAEARPLTHAAAYLEQLAALSGRAFNADDWKPFI